MTDHHLEVLILIIEGTDIRDVPAALYRAEERMPENQSLEGDVHQIIADGELTVYGANGWKQKPCRRAVVVVPRPLFDAAIAEALVRHDYVSVGCDESGEEPLLAILGPSQGLGPRSCAPWLKRGDDAAVWAPGLGPANCNRVLAWEGGDFFAQRCERCTHGPCPFWYADRTRRGRE